MIDSTKSSSGASNGKQPYEYIPALLKQRMVAEMSYLIARKRGYTSGYELRDWFEAERIIGQQFPEA